MITIAGTAKLSVFSAKADYGINAYRVWYFDVHLYRSHTVTAIMKIYHNENTLQLNL